MGKKFKLYHNNKLIFLIAYILKKFITSTTWCCIDVDRIFHTQEFIEVINIELAEMKQILLKDGNNVHKNNERTRGFTCVEVAHEQNRLCWTSYCRSLLHRNKYHWLWSYLHLRRHAWISALQTSSCLNYKWWHLERRLYLSTYECIGLIISI